MRNRKVKIFALVMAGCLCLSGLTGCGGGIKMTTDDTSSKSDSGLMGSAKKEADKSDDSEADSADKEDKISDDMIGRYVSQGYENPSFGKSDDGFPAHICVTILKIWQSCCSRSIQSGPQDI